MGYNSEEHVAEEIWGGVTRSTAVSFRCKRRFVHRRMCVQLALTRSVKLRAKQMFTKWHSSRSEQKAK